MSNYLTINETLEKIYFIFPLLVIKWPSGVKDFDQFDYDRNQRGYWSMIRHMQDALKQHVTMTIKNLQNKSPTGYSLLKTQDNGAAFYLALGMNIEFVKERFYFVRNAQEELGVIKGKTPPLVCLFSLIDSINSTNPWGHVTNGEIVQQAERTTEIVLKNGHKVISKETLDLTEVAMDLRYMGVEAKKDNLKESVNQAEQILKSVLPNYENLFMHATTGVGLEKIFKNQRFNPSLTESQHMLEHDFGPGVYCCRGKMLWALSFAFDRYWPFGTTVKQVEGKSFITEAVGVGSNPSIVVFLMDACKTKAMEDQIYDVHAKLPFGKDGKTGGNQYGNGLQDLDYREFIIQRYQNYIKEYRETSNDNLDKFLFRHPSYTKETMLNWLLFVKMVRAEQIEWHPEGKFIIKGLLHDSLKTHVADETGEGHPPKPDMDGWVQYCFQDAMALSKKCLFLEFHVDWDEWKLQGQKDWEGEEEWKADQALVEKICAYDHKLKCYTLECASESPQSLAS